MEHKIRNAARRFLPDPIRRPLGALAGKVNENVVSPLLGTIFDLMGGRFYADDCVLVIPRDVTTRKFRAAFLIGTYEHQERTLIRRWVHPDDVVIELGACLGIVSCVTNKLLKDKTKHVVVEANPFCIAAIYRNKELNQSGFLIEHCAVDTRPEVTFFLPSTYIVGGTSLRATERQFRLPAKSLRQLEQERGPFTTLIIDIEGSEREVFEQSRDLLKRYRLVIVELHDFAIGADGVERCRQVLRECGLEFVERVDFVEAWVRREL